MNRMKSAEIKDGQEVQEDKIRKRLTNLFRINYRSLE